MGHGNAPKGALRCVIVGTQTPCEMEDLEAIDVRGRVLDYLSASSVCPCSASQAPALRT